ncbi:MAG: NADPH-dependent 7-cyano-7-deazaguanine reductase QueF [Desulforhopalus sp.]|nr:NADPH-dependent 7-cyano-7-deazaguanine reductase QueF [Desulforhopalus sp.]
MDNNIPHIPLGKQVTYPSSYKPELLFPVARRLNREKIGISGGLPFTGVDIWNAYEVSWLEPEGKPQVAIAEIRFSLDTVNIIESKSFKLYLNSFNQTHFSSAEDVVQVIGQDLQQAVQGEVTVSLTLPNDFHRCQMIEPEGLCLDELDITTDCYSHKPDFLTHGANRIEECLYSNLLRTNCPVTGQPDWATLIINYTGKKINRNGLLSYIISFREHTGFHENCVEQIFLDLMQYCSPEKLSVYARFTRRGGVDINPFRSTADHFAIPDNIRLARQ